MFTLEAQNAHPSSLLALEALGFLKETHQFTTILDMGCGNGVLSITAAHMWEARITAVDISPNAVADTKAALAGFSPPLAIECFVSDGFKHPKIQQSAPYDFIICNLLAQWQIRMASEIKKHLEPSGIIVLSGILSWQMEDVLAAYTTIGFIEKQRLNQSPWHCLVLGLQT